MTDDSEKTIKGYVKWFDPSKGFGFVALEDGADDALLHANVLREYGQGSVADNTQITAKIQTTARGLQVIEILEMCLPQTPTLADLEDIQNISPEKLAAIPAEPARVKWFDKNKGFGFANVFGQSEDVFLHIEIVRQAGWGNLNPGEAIAIQVIDGNRGKMASSILPWERS